MRLSDEDHAELVRLYREAQETPVLLMGINHEINVAERAWERVAKFMDLLGNKYGYNPRTARITMDSPEIHSTIVETEHGKT